LDTNTDPNWVAAREVWTQRQSVIKQIFLDNIIWIRMDLFLIRDFIELYKSYNALHKNSIISS